MSASSEITIEPIRHAGDIAVARTLFREYMSGLGVDLSFQNAEAELATLPGKYAVPEGTILIAWNGTEAVGCVALRPLAEAGACEIKRLYVRPAARGRDLGRRLAVAAIECARVAGYKRIRLDTLAAMAAAQALYRSLGFRPTDPYYNNPLPGTQYLALDL